MYEDYTCDVCGQDVNVNVFLNGDVYEFMRDPDFEDEEGKVHAPHRCLGCRYSIETYGTTPIPHSIKN